MTLPVEACAIEILLPQTQCRQCGFDGCAQYAAAISEGRAPINRCAPGGAAGIEKLARATGLPKCELDPEYGRELPYSTARIRAHDCIGCALCAAACPVDVVSGVAKHLFAVIEEACTGCGLCVCACPVNAVEMIENGHVWTTEDAARAKADYERTNARRKASAEQRRAQLEKATDNKSAVLMQALLKAKSLKKS